jgi:NADH-quinone oxidoreductase subunit C/WASH complex subunit FAM21
MLRELIKVNFFRMPDASMKFEDSEHASSPSFNFTSHSFKRTSEMKAVILTLSMALASLLGANAFAQSKGEVDAEQSKAAPAKPATKEEKAAARKERIAAGKEAARTTSTADDLPSSAGKAKTVSQSEKKSAASKRKAETIEAVKKGATTSGEK